MRWAGRAGHLRRGDLVMKSDQGVVRFNELNVLFCCGWAANQKKEDTEKEGETER